MSILPRLTPETIDIGFKEMAKSNENKNPLSNFLKEMALIAEDNPLIPVLVQNLTVGTRDPQGAAGCLWTLIRILYRQADTDRIKESVTGDKTHGQNLQAEDGEK